MNKKKTELIFVRGSLTIPRIKISDITEALYRNIILFEQCHRFRCLLLPLYEVPHLLPHIP
ncbi:unnamed protein product, partial [Brassica rapa subsp. trilocularis]